MADLPLPSGWIQEYDANHNHPYWVDTQGDPPRAIWVHPYEDDQFLSEHLEIKDKLSERSGEVDQPPPCETQKDVRTKEESEAEMGDRVEESVRHKEDHQIRIADANLQGHPAASARTNESGWVFGASLGSGVGSISNPIPWGVPTGTLHQWETHLVWDIRMHSVDAGWGSSKVAGAIVLEL